MTDTLTETYGAGWSFWTSRHGAYHAATRRRDLSPAEFRDGLAMTLIAESAQELADALADQVRREASR